jgi:two-component system response regulator HupR/HoxA
LSTILAVDDEPAILQLTRWTLKRKHEVLIAPSGEEALQILEAQPVDMVVSDLRMPGMSGLELLAIVRERWPKAIRVLATAYTTHEDTLRAVQEVGIYKLLAKPWLPEELVEVVEHGLIDRARMI